MRGLSRKRLIRIAGARQHDKGQSIHDIRPSPPSWQLRQKVSPHHPDESDARETPQQHAQRINRVGGAEGRLDPAGNDTTTVGDPTRAVQALRQRRHAAGGF